MNLTLKELLTYAEEEQNRWYTWFETHGDEPLKFPLGDRTLGSLIQHAFGAELWFAEHLAGTAHSEWWTKPTDTADALFEVGRAAKQKLGEVIDQTPPDQWSRTVDLEGRGQHIRVSARKAVGNALIHGIRHWAQVAAIVRQHGIAPPGDHDLILSHALE